MSKLKIKEFPINDLEGSSQFKEGDNIITYTENYRQRVETIGSVEEDHIVTLDGGHIHYKCCRKIEYIKPREFWLCQGSDGSDNISHTKPDNHEIWIHVREVLDEDN